jgi:NAD+ kinase
MRRIKRVGFVIKPHAAEVKDALGRLSAYFSEREIDCLFEDVAAVMLGSPARAPREEIPGRVDLVVVLGGDGTLLSVAQNAAVHKIPVLGINLGRLGFLTEVPLDEAFLSLDAFLAGNQSIINPRMMISVLKGRETFHCLNDVVFNKGALARMIQVKIWIDNKEIAVLKADGLIVSTPTGSTAYSLSAGGPIVHPFVPAIIIAPICPHTLTFRPMIITSNAEIKIELQTEHEEVYCTLDGQRGGLMAKDEIIVVKKSEHSLSLVSSPLRTYFDLIHEKLGWGINP